MWIRTRNPRPDKRNRLNNLRRVLSYYTYTIYCYADNGKVEYPYQTGSDVLHNDKLYLHAINPDTHFLFFFYFISVYSIKNYLRLNARSRRPIWWYSPAISDLGTHLIISGVRKLRLPKNVTLIHRKLLPTKFCLIFDVVLHKKSGDTSDLRSDSSMITHYIASKTINVTHKSLIFWQQLYIYIFNSVYSVIYNQYYERSE